MDPHNPYTAEHKITLADGVERVFRIGANEMVLIEEATGLNMQQILHARSSVRLLRAALYAGLQRDAKGRGESWSLERAGELLPMARLLELQRIVGMAIVETLVGPEAERKSPEPAASASVTAAKPKPGRGKKR